MNFSQLSMDLKICALVNYASVFNDVIKVQEVIERIDLSKENEIRNQIIKLIKEGVILESGGFLCLPFLKDRIAQKEAQETMSKRFIEMGKKYLSKLSVFPFIEFIGISGSLAAGNPVSSSKNPIDIDVFVITSKNSVWITGFFLAIYKNMTKRKTGSLCFNHVWDSSDMKVYNNNFYVATEIQNMISVFGQERFKAFLDCNPWVYNYYPALLTNSKNDPSKPFKEYPKILNSVFFFLFTIIRSLKNVSLRPFNDFFNKPDQFHHISIKRKGAENGGYQKLIRERFLRNWEIAFSPQNLDFIDQILFPDILSQRMKKDKCFDPFFRLKRREKDKWALNQDKYI